ncbi:MAG: acetyl-CoA carboxylase biotin carboxyl carrier protein [Ruminococcaceae bacterium]|nr:acetyl-CoA carboxylase biotin carboxyl carrier protein [Oscillospiraceae bacterium]
MDKNELLETVNALTEQVNIAQLDELEVETDEFRIRLSKRPPMPSMPPLNMNVPTVSTEVRTQISETAAETPKAAGRIIKSPIIGTFYAAAAPGKPAFVSVGSKVAKGGVVCIVESMKLMNEITSEFDGIVAEIFVNDGEAVEYDQPLFRLD